MELFWVLEKQKTSRKDHIEYMSKNIEGAFKQASLLKNEKNLETNS